MRQLLIICLLLSSFFFLLSGCSINKYGKHNKEQFVSTEKQIAPIITPNQPIKFKTTIDVLKNHLSGIVIAKQTDSLTTHIIFVTELGMRMFDLEAKGDSIKALYVFEPLNKPAIVNVLKENFKHMFLLNLRGKTIHKCETKKSETVMAYLLGKQKVYLCSKSFFYYYIYLQEVFHGKKRTSKINYEVVDNKYQKITAKQYGLVKFYFELINITD